MNDSRIQARAKGTTNERAMENLRDACPVRFKVGRNRDLPIAGYVCKTVSTRQTREISPAWVPPLKQAWKGIRSSVRFANVDSSDQRHTHGNDMRPAMPDRVRHRNP